MIRKILAVVLAACALFSCGPVSDNPPSARIEDSPCYYNFEQALIEPLPHEYHGITPTHAVRAEVYACDERTWRPIGGLASVSIEAITLDPRVQGGVVKAGAGAPWPYENMSARLGFQFPIAIPAGIQVAVSAHFTTIIDKGEMISCWLVEPQGHIVPGTRYNTVQTRSGQPTTVDCGGLLGETA